MINNLLSFLWFGKNGKFEQQRNYQEEIIKNYNLVLEQLVNHFKSTQKSTYWDKVVDYSYTSVPDQHLQVDLAKYQLDPENIKFNEPSLSSSFVVHSIIPISLSSEDAMTIPAEWDFSYNDEYMNTENIFSEIMREMDKNYDIDS